MLADAGNGNVRLPLVRPDPGAVFVLFRNRKSTFCVSGAVAGQYSATASFGFPGPLLNVTVIVPPSTMLDGLIPIVGPVTVNVAPLDVPPPGVGVNTVMVCVPPD